MSGDKDTRQAQLLMRYIEQLQEGDSTIPAGLDPEMAAFARKLLLSRLPDHAGRSRMWSSIMGQLDDADFLEAASDEYKFEDDNAMNAIRTHDSMDTPRRKPIRFPITLVAAILALVLAALVILPMTQRPDSNGDDGNGDGNGAALAAPDDVEQNQDVMTATPTVTASHTHTFTPPAQVNATATFTPTASFTHSATPIDDATPFAPTAVPPEGESAVVTNTPMPTEQRPTVPAAPPAQSGAMLFENGVGYALMPVVVAARPITRGTLIEAQMLDIVYAETDSVIVDSITTFDGVVGNYANVNIAPYQAVSVDMLDVVSPIGQCNAENTVSIPKTNIIVDEVTPTVGRQLSLLFIAQIEGSGASFPQLISPNALLVCDETENYVFNLEEAYKAAQIGQIINAGGMLIATVPNMVMDAITIMPSDTQGAAPQPVQIIGNGDSSVSFSEVISAGDIANEGIVLENSGNTVDLSGWTLMDSNGNSYIIPEDTRLFSEATLTLYSGSGDNTPISLYLGRETSFFGADGGIVSLIDAAGFLVATVSQPAP